MPLYVYLKFFAERSAGAYRGRLSNSEAILGRPATPSAITGSGLILRRLLIQQGDEFAARSRNANLALRGQSP